MHLWVVIIVFICLLIIFKNLKKAVESEKEPIPDPLGSVYEYHVANKSHHIREFNMKRPKLEVFPLAIEALGLLTFCTISRKDPEQGYIAAGLDWNIDSRDDAMQIKLRESTDGGTIVNISCEVQSSDGKTVEDNKYAVDVLQQILMSKDSEFHPLDDGCEDELDSGYAFTVDKYEDDSAKQI